MDASQPIRAEIWGLRFFQWLIGWQARVTGWAALVVGVAVGDWFQRADGSSNWVQAVVAFVSVPLAQWAIKRRIANREKLLPRLGPKGEIVYGSDSSD
jgi:hypothetical protein